jgi:hypothetical protein
MAFVYTVLSVLSAQTERIKAQADISIRQPAAF